MTGIIVLEDGTVFQGMSFGAPGEALGEVVFNTSMAGYQEVLTDPSYASQIVTMTYPLIGNYGVNDYDVESDRIQVEGFVVKEACRYPSNHESAKTLGEYLIENGIVGIEGIDTRALTRHIRLAGAMKAVIWAGEGEPSVDELVDKARAWAGLVGVDTVKDVTCEKPYAFAGTPGRGDAGDDRLHVVAFDYGIKLNILRILRGIGCRISVVPAATGADEVLAMKPDGVFLSNGPGDPAAVAYAVAAIRQLIGKVPIFGICLGHQLLSLALGGKTYKLKFGHHGANHPVRNLATGAIEITSQNHGFCADIDSLRDRGIRMTHLNLNDHTCEGIADLSQRLFSVQYHPEASPGPHDSGYLFGQFVEMMEKG
ncbi:MAG: glutamine-hydrolyzing carbamoyl-phosphate synthase small subunit [Chitinivibrionales bacterium]|nr:glutamine-hydrolyzing carbamoyl-phosphate synthase small subunit [Chitinivibrionales bacterium]MBD3394281.1 glutamine-hydrolyzing carbamoyl-phosphate synthase small subunit [Chitinivibrionales bacterium]